MTSDLSHAPITARRAVPGFTAILIATAPADGKGAAAALPWENGTVAGRLRDQVVALGAAEVHVVTRPAWTGALAGPAVHVHASPGIAEDLRAVAMIAAAAEGPVALVDAGVVTQQEALAGLLADPRIPSGILAATPDADLAAATAEFLGVVKLAGRDRAILCRVALGLADARPRETGGGAIALVARTLVEQGVALGLARLRGLFWARPSSAAEIDRAAAEIALHDEERARLDSAVKATDGFFTTFLVSPYSKYIARWAARRGWTPNAVTYLSMAVGTVAAAAFATGERAGLIAGAVMLQVAFTLDCVDGQIARYTRTFTPLGAWLDSIFDRGKEYLVYAGLAVGATRTGDDVWLLAGATLALQTVRHAGDFAFVAERATPPSEPAGQWVRKIVGFPIGERFALISITAALFDARVCFLALLAWGAMAAAYATLGRVRRSLGARREIEAAAATAPGADVLAAYRDDGAVAVALGRPGRRLPAAASVVLAPLGGLGLLAAAAVAGNGATWELVAAAVAWAVLCAGASAGRVRADPLRWSDPPLLRVIEYGGVLWIAAVAGEAAHPAAFALLAAVAFRHYDVAYRYAQRGVTPPRPLALALGGWDGRMIVAAALGAAGVAATGFFVLAAVLGALAAGEAVAAWLRGGDDAGWIAHDGGA